MGLGDRKKLIETVEPREVVTFAPVEEPPLPDVDIEEAQERAKRQKSREAFDTPALRDARALNSVGAAHSATAIRASQLE